jgi:hypothetical protein
LSYDGLAADGLADGSGVSGGFGGEGAFQLGDYRCDAQERDAACALVGGVNAQRVLAGVDLENGGDVRGEGEARANRAARIGWRFGCARCCQWLT